MSINEHRSFDSTHTYRKGPIQSCISRFKNCNKYSKNLPGSSGNLVKTDLTLPMRITRLINYQSTLRNAQWNEKYVPLNAYGQRPGGPNGYGQPIKNIF